MSDKIYYVKYRRKKRMPTKHSIDTRKANNPKFIIYRSSKNFS